VGIEQIKQIFQSGLRNTEMNQEPFMVLFTGVPFSGKSTVAKVLQHRYSMVRLENDRVRELVMELDVEVEDPRQFVLEFIKDYSEPNQRIVLDASIDRSYERVLNICEENDISYFVIKMPVPEDMDKRAHEKGGFRLERWKDADLEKFVKDHEKAMGDIEPDFRFGKDGGMRNLLEELDRFFR
jgi:tRNA uridine 5-carbamoylmethylation protein Kti12